MTRGTTVSVVIPAFNEELNVDRAYQAVRDVFMSLPDHRYEIIFTDNHSTDRTPELMATIAARDPAVRVIRFSRNVGYNLSLLHGYRAATGDCAVQIDCDLQDPPALIPEMLGFWRQGYQVVYGVRRNRYEGRLISLARRAFYRLINSLSDDELPLNAGEFRLIDRRILHELRSAEDTTPYVRGLISSFGFSQIGFEYNREARLEGESKFPFSKLVALAVDGILNHSLIPLRIATFTSFAIGFATTIFIFIYVLGRIFFGQDWPAGFATTTALQLLTISLNAIFLGIIGEYLGRIFLQVKKRPRPIVEIALNFDRSPEAPPPREAALAGGERLRQRSVGVLENEQ